MGRCRIRQSNIIFGLRNTSRIPLLTPTPRDLDRGKAWQQNWEVEAWLQVIVYRDQGIPMI